MKQNLLELPKDKLAEILVKTKVGLLFCRTCHDKVARHKKQIKIEDRIDDAATEGKLRKEGNYC